MQRFDATQVERIDYVYRGAVGGEGTAARVQFKGPVKIRGDAAVQWYDPGKMTEMEAWEFRNLWSSACGETTPDWFAFSFDRRMRMFREAQEEADDKSPRYLDDWYIDDQRNVVYFRGVRG